MSEKYDDDWDKRLEVFNPESLITNKRNSMRIIVEKVKNFYIFDGHHILPIILDGENDLTK